MTDKEALKAAMKSRKWTQTMLASELGYAGPSGIANLFYKNENGIRIDVLCKLFKAMGYEIIVRDKMGSGTEYKIDMVASK